MFKSLIFNYAVELSDGYYGRIGTGISVIALIIAAFAVSAYITRSKSAFEKEQARAVAANPMSVFVELTTVDGRRKYRDGDAILFKAHFYSTQPFQYKIDVGDGVSLAAASDILHWSNRQLTRLNATPIICCGSRYIGLDEEGFTAPTLTPWQAKPGDYEVYLTSRRVFTWDVGKQEYNPSSFEVTSNLLKIHVVSNAK